MKWRAFLWSVRRELWESRSIYLAPLIVAGVFLCGFAISVGRLPRTVHAAMVLDPMKQRAAIAAPYDAAAGLIMLTMMIVGAFYCLDALYGERRDRSTLFWKSLPVSDLTTVLAKASVPLVILPLLGFAVTFAMHAIMLLLSSAVLAASGQSVAMLWSQVALGRMSFLLLYHLIAMHSLWHAPLYAWLLLVSAWARRTPFVWAFVPLLAIGFLEKIAFNTTYFASMLSYRLGGDMGVTVVAGTFPTHPMTHLTPLAFLADPGLWIGFAFTALFLAAAVRLRRSRGPI